MLTPALQQADLGPAPQIVQTSDVTPAHAQGQLNQPAEGDEEETFYYDEATGAVYDAQGRLVEMPPGFDASVIQPHQETLLDHPLAARPLTGDTMQGTDARSAPTSEILASPRQPERAMSRNRMDDNASLPSAAPSYRGRSFEDPAGMANGNHLTRISLDRKDSNGSSIMRDMNAPMLANAKPMSGFPSMDALSESREGTPVRPTSRDVGLTATGAPQLDQARRGSGQSIGMVPSTMRQRTNRLSQYADAGLSPTTDLKFQLDAPSYDELDEMDGKYRPSVQLGQGEGLVHPSYQGAEVGSKGLRMVELEMETEEDSPYPEVRASVSNIDDPDMPVGTFRAWFLSFLLSTIAGAVNMLLNFRYPAPTLTPIVVQLITYPFGKLLAAILPIRTWTLPKWLGGGSFSLNPGQFNIKEHTLIAIVMNISIAQAYGINSTIALNSPQFYNSPRPIGFSILFVVSSQLLGFSVAGICRRFLVWPASMIWPQNLVTATILNTLHAEEDGADGTMTRFRFFSLVCGGAFIWFFVPGFLFQALSSFSWLCWIWPSECGG